MKTLFDYASKEEKQQAAAEEKEKKISKLNAFYMKWSLTKEALTDKAGNMTTENIARKAMGFLDHDCVRKMTNQPPGQGEYWICEPMPGYNVTTYTMYFYVIDDMVVTACNCQYCKTKSRMCSHILAMLILNKVHLLKKWIKNDGVRDYKRLREYI